jgi:hypothetical protein
MRSTPYSVRKDADKLMRCCACGGALRAGEDAVVRCKDGWVEHAHVSCSAPTPVTDATVAALTEGVT